MRNQDLLRCTFSCVGLFLTVTIAVAWPWMVSKELPRNRQNSQLAADKPHRQRKVSRHYQPVERVHLKAVKCKFNDCDAPDCHGDIYIVRSGQRTRLTSHGNSGGNSGDPLMDPKITPNRRTVGWIEGKHHTHYPGNTRFYGRQLVLWRDGRVLRRIHGSLWAVGPWFFWNRGRQVALKSRNAHGPAINQLHDVATGRLVAKHRPSESGGPAWSRRLGD